MKQKLFTVIAILAVVLGAFSGGRAMQRAKAAEATCYVDAGATGTNDGSTWGNAFTDLQSALDPASGCTRALVAAGTYHPSPTSAYWSTFQMRSGLEIIGGYPAGGGDTPDPANNPTILDGENNPAERPLW